VTMTFVWQAIALLCLSLQGCGERPQACKEFLDMPRPQLRAQFETFPLEKQIDVYLCAMKVEPPDVGLANKIADRGEGALPVLMQRLKSSGQESKQEDIIYVLEVMSDHGSLRGRKDLVADIGRVIDEMKSGPVRERCAERLRKIEVNSGIKPFTYTR
jgi:hypothetical protein